jgi:hypothetical protein
MCVVDQGRCFEVMLILTRRVCLTKKKERMNGNALMRINDIFIS